MVVGYLSGEILFSDGRELILKTPSGIGYQVHFYDILVEGSKVNIFISHVIREASEDLFGFKTLRDKKLC
jgi:Holliday junction DNA helicase RuvA